MDINKVIGHLSAKQALLNSIKCGKVGHAYIFEGICGVGRLSLAKAFAGELVGNKSPDTVIVTNELYNPSKQSKNVLVDTIRSMKADVYIRPYSSDKKIYIIPNADTMQEAAQNSLLKVFEEPPEYCVIILIAENANSLLPTIRSRAQLIRLAPLSRTEVMNYLIENNVTDKEKAEIISVLSGGSIGRAIELSEDTEAVQKREEVISYLIGLCGQGVRPLYDFIKHLKQSKTEINFILNIISDWSIDVLHIKNGMTDSILNADKTKELSEFCGKITVRTAFRLGEIVTKYSLAISRNANYPIAVSCMATEYWEEINGRSYRSAF